MVKAVSLTIIVVLLWSEAPGSDSGEASHAAVLVAWLARRERDLSVPRPRMLKHRGGTLVGADILLASPSGGGRSCRLHLPCSMRRLLVCATAVASIRPRTSPWRTGPSHANSRPAFVAFSAPSRPNASMRRPRSKRRSTSSYGARRAKRDVWPIGEVFLDEGFSRTAPASRSRRPWHHER